ncbi:MAG TPA: filamentous hemagglutinin N-terminal domain-containing protein [Verrucomicrobiae bacterium]
MARDTFSYFRRTPWEMRLLVLFISFQVHANPPPPLPTGGSVVQGTATIITPPAQPNVLNVNQSSAAAMINWATFDINAGNTVNFNQPSATSVTWNQISEAQASTIDGNINANGYVVLQNPNGFYIGGTAAITAHGMIMTTAATPALNLSSGGAWAFDAPPPTAQIVNYGKITINGGGSAYLIASDIINNGTLSAEGGSIGLYDGETVLVSMSPDGRGLSAEVTLPQGSVDNEGQLTADGGRIVAQAQLVNQNGIVQANTAQNVNGTIELLGSSSVTLGASSAISTMGDSTASSPSPGGSVQIQSGSFSDQAGSSINVAGASQGGNGGQISVSAPQMTAIQSTLNGQAAAGYLNGTLSIDTADIALNSDGSPVASSLALNVNSLSSGFSQINLQASDDITLDAQWTLTPNGGVPTDVSLLAGNQITLDASSEIQAQGGNITLNAPVVDQGGTLGADSIGSANGIIEIDANQSLILEASSVITADGDPTTTSPGGFVVLKAGNAYSDSAGSTISVSGNSGGQDGIIEIFAPSASINSTIVGNYFAYLVNPYDMTLSYDNTLTSTTPSSDPNFDVFDLAAYSQIDLQAMDDIDFESPEGFSTFWSLNDSTIPDSTLSLTAGNNINLPVDIFEENAGLQAGKDWNVNLTAGVGVYVWGGSSIQAENGNINIMAGSEVQVGWTGSESPGQANGGNGFINTMAGGNINVTAALGDVNTGSGLSGFDFSISGPYFTAASIVGGISTIAGGNVTINAGGDVTSLSATTSTPDPNSGAFGDPGTGAFGAEPGNVTINAAGNVYGHFVEVDGTGAINAGQDIGTVDQNVALSLVAGDWTLNAQNDIYLQEVRNPNGLFNNTTINFGSQPSRGNHLFDYSPNASVNLNAGNGVYITGLDMPRPSDAVQMLLPPVLTIDAGAGGVTLDTPSAIDDLGSILTLPDYNITMFPSVEGELQITTTGGGSLTSGNAAGNPAYLLMSDSGQSQWSAVSSTTEFGPYDHASVPFENNDPVILNISGDINNVFIQVPKLAEINVDGNLINSYFYGENENASDLTSITVGGNIEYTTSFASVTLADVLPDIVQLSDALPNDETYLPSGSIDNWFTLLLRAVTDPSISGINNSTYSDSENLTGILGGYLMFPGLNVVSLDYNPTTQKLTVSGPLSAPGDAASTPDTLYNILSTGTLYLPVYQNGEPLLDSSGHFVINAVTWLPQNTTTYTDPDLASLQTLLNNSQNDPPLGPNGALIVGGTGTFDVTANSINLGNSDGILSVGDGGDPSNPFLGQVSYSFLAPYITSGATINVIANTLEMPSSTIAALGGGDVNITATGIISGSTLNSHGVGVSMDLGSPDLADFEFEIMHASNLGLGIYSTGGGDVNVTGLGTINIDTSRIASLNGGNVTVTSLTGDVDAGSGGATGIPFSTFPLSISLKAPYEYVLAYGIVADTLAVLSPNHPVPGAATSPGNIYVNTPQGDINANLGGILQQSLGVPLLPGPSVNLDAGSPGYVGDINLGNAGVIGGTVNATATGKISGLLISQQNANVSAAAIGSLTVFAVGKATVTGSGDGPGITIIGGQGVSTTGIGTGATLLGQNVSVNGGAAQSTLGSSASSTATSQSAAQQSTQTANQQVTDTGNEGDQNKKKQGPQIRKVGRVTVLLSAAMPK